MPGAFDDKLITDGHTTVCIRRLQNLVRLELDAQ